jgi:hypothetical protein
VVNNIIVNNEAYGIKQSDADGVYENTVFDHNLYHHNGWRAFEDGGEWKAGAMVVYVASGPDGYYQTLTDIQASTPWETHGVEGDPKFVAYDVMDHDLFDGSRPDFHLTPSSHNALDRGNTALPASLVTLLGKFDVYDPKRGNAYDIGRYEGGFDILPTPTYQAVKPGGAATYTLATHPPDLAQTVALTVTSPSPDLLVSVNPPYIAPGAVATLIVTDTHAGSGLMPGLQYNIPIAGAAGGFTDNVNVRLLVGGAGVYLPLTLKGY